MKEAAILRLGIGNVASVQFALERLGARVRFVATADEIQSAERLVFPGVGAAGFAMARLGALGIAKALRDFPRPLLGLCLGHQILFERSEEGGGALLGRIKGSVVALAPGPHGPVPHMGWTRLAPLKDDPLTQDLGSAPYVYFVHSFAAPIGESAIAAANYGQDFCAIARSGQAWGCQFHPERSSKAGARLLANFMDLPC